MTSFRVARITLFSFLLCLLLGLGLWIRYLGHTDSCTHYLAGDTRFPSTQWVLMGTRRVEVPCNRWLERMPQTFQILCLLDVTFGTIFLVNVLVDLRLWVQRRRKVS
jgi:hypothetical protein